MKPIPNYEGRYSADANGVIHSHSKRKSGPMRPKKTKLGYRVIGLRGGDGKKSFFPVHRLVVAAHLGAFPRLPVDHRDGDKTNNALENLRVCTPSQNQGNRKTGKDNTSGFKGVCWQKNIGKWQAACRINGSRKYGWFDTKEEAARYYDQIAREAHGEFARTNFPD